MGLVKDDSQALASLGRVFVYSTCMCVCVFGGCMGVMNGPVPGSVPSVALDQSAYLLAANTASD